MNLEKKCYVVELYDFDFQGRVTILFIQNTILNLDKSFWIRFKLYSNSFYLI